MDGITPTIDLNGNNNGWGNGLIGAAIGGFAGAAIGNNWNGRNNNGCCNNSGCCDNGSRYVMDSLSGLRTDVGSISRDGLIQSAAAQNAACQGFSGVNTAVREVAAQIAQGQSRTEAAVLTTGLNGQIQGLRDTIEGLKAQHNNEVQSLRNTSQLQAGISECCCNTQRSIDAVVKAIGECCCETNRNLDSVKCAIHVDGEQTRALISKFAYEQLQEKLCDAKAENAALRAEKFASINNDVQTRTLLGAILPRLETTTGTAAAAVAGV